MSTLLLDMKQHATDRFMRDAKCCCNGTERFLLLHHTMYYCWPKFSGNTIVRIFRPWSLMLEKRRVGSLKYMIFLQKVLHLEIKFPSRGKEEVENWRQRTRHPSVP